MIRRMALLALGMTALASSAVPARAEEPPTVSIPAPPIDAGRARLEHPTARPGSEGANGTESSTGGWINAAGLLVLIVLGGGGAVALLRNRSTAGSSDGTTLQVIGRAALGTRHAAFVVRAGDRMLVVGVGTGGGPPTLLAELDPVESLDHRPAVPIVETLPLRLASRPEGQGRPT